MPQSAVRIQRSTRSSVVARAPTRIDLGGGWTDVPPYSDREGGFVCNVAITRYATANISRERDAGSSIRDPLIDAAIRRSHLSGVTAGVNNDFPVGAGLGGSSAASAALLGALRTWRGDEWNLAEIAEEGRRIEVEELGVAGGRQDHYAATHGGALALTFAHDVSVRRISLTPSTVRDLRERSILVYTGQSRISGDTITAVLGAYEAGERRVATALRRMREIAQDIARTLERGDIDGIGGLLSEHWIHQRSLHSSIPTERIDEIIARASGAGALGSKAMGASGGGCVLIIARRENVRAVMDAVRPLGSLIDFDIDSAGLTLVSDTP